MLNDALFYEFYEIIGGEKFMPPAPILGHSDVIAELLTSIKIYLREKKCGRVFGDNIDVHLPDGNLFKPDLVVVTAENFGIMDWAGSIHGVPDMVVEVLSNFTRRNDLTVKKDVYEKNGGKEYWIVDPRSKTIDVYILRDGKFELDDSYCKYSVKEWDNLDDKEKAAFKPEIPVSIFDDLFIKVDDIFSWGYDY